MANEEHHKTPAEYEDRAWELIGKIKFALFTMRNGDLIQQWPLSAMPDRDAGVVHFLVGNRDGKYARLEANSGVTLGFADTDGQKYVVVAGEAVLSNDRAKIKELFSPFAKAWWDSADDPDIRLLTVTPERAELWDAPGKLISAAIMLSAAVTGAKPAVGDHGTARM